jgi:di/tricarboxylate transporter
LGINPIPFVYIVTALGNCGFALPSSAGGPAVAAGYGINLQTMLWKGLLLTVLALVTILGTGYLLATYWEGFGRA